MSDFTRRQMVAGAAAAAVAGTIGFDPLPARAAAPATGKQAPGYYRYKVGDIEVTVVTDGGRDIRITEGLVRNANVEEVGAALEAAFLPKDKYMNPFNPCAINTGGKLVIVDTGLGQSTFEQSKGAVGQFLNNLAAANIDRNNVDMVIISHFHGDHINGLLMADSKPAYPNAEVMVPSVEWDYWMDDGNMSRAPEALKGNFNNARRVFSALGKQPTQYGDGKEIISGITAIATPGHTPGHMSFRVSSGSGTVIIQSDVTNNPAIYVRNPGWHFAFDMDPNVAETSRRKLYDQIATDRLMVQGFHFPFPAVGYASKESNGYRYVPAPWNPVL